MKLVYCSSVYAGPEEPAGGPGQAGRPATKCQVGTISFPFRQLVSVC